MICCVVAALVLLAAVWIRRSYRAVVGGKTIEPLAWRLDNREQHRELVTAKKFSVMARLKSFAHAFDGLALMVRHEHNAWVHVVAAGLAVSVGILLQITVEDWRWVILAIGLVWSAEALNTALEHACDTVSPGLNEGIRKAKDVAAGAVLVSAAAAAVLGGLVFAPYIVADQAPMLDQISLCLSPR